MGTKGVPCLAGPRAWVSNFLAEPQKNSTQKREMLTVGQICQNFGLIAIWITAKCEISMVFFVDIQVGGSKTNRLYGWHVSQFN
jgi:hypothetical protein